MDRDGPQVLQGGGAVATKADLELHWRGVTADGK